MSATIIRIIMDALALVTATLLLNRAASKK